MSGSEQKQEIATAGGRRDLDLWEHIKAVEQAAKDWGVEADAYEGKFVSALLAAIAATGRTNLATLGDLEKLLERARATAQAETGRLEVLMEGGAKVLDMAREAAVTASVAGERAEREFDRSVGHIAKELSQKLLHQSQQWLVLKQTNRNRRDAWRLAGGVAACAVGLVIAGFEFRSSYERSETQELLGMKARIEKCVNSPVWVTMDPKAARVPACWLGDILFDNGWPEGKGAKAARS